MPRVPVAAPRAAGSHAAAAAGALALLTFLVFSRAMRFPFLNWDDLDVFTRNEALRAPGLLAWALTTRYMEHYQPLSWLTWGTVERTSGLTPFAAHALSISLHAACALLVYVLCRRLTRAAALAAGLAALIWAVHPLRVEPVVWASAMPYALASIFVLAATLAWIEDRSLTASFLFTLSLLARPLALGLPAVLWILRRPESNRARGSIGAMAVVAVAAALAESSARLAASIDEFGAGARLTLAATAPWRYLWRTVAPVELTPLDPLALAPRTDTAAIVLGLAGILIASAAAWRSRRTHPALAGAWASYLLLLFPAMGLLPSGLQATADRYTYLPAVPLSVALASILATTNRARASVPAATAVVVLSVLTWQQVQHWRDSIALWTRAVTIDPRNDVALYNLGAALSEAGRRPEALARYEQVLAIVPGHEAARRNRDLLEAERLEGEANALAGRRDLDGAIARYTEALRLDPRRTHSRTALGVALMERGRYADARQHLQAAIEHGAADPAAPNALAYVLVRMGEADAAVRVLREAQQRFPRDANIARNLSMLEGRR